MECCGDFNLFHCSLAQDWHVYFMFYNHVRHNKIKLQATVSTFMSVK